MAADERLPSACQVQLATSFCRSALTMELAQHSSLIEACKSRHKAFSELRNRHHTENLAFGAIPGDLGQFPGKNLDRKVDERLGISPSNIISEPGSELALVHKV